jgi:CMP/dCMP kinase
MYPDKSYIIAIDGYSSCGKSTFAKAIARELNLMYVDSGAMYRAVALYCLEQGLYGDGNIDKENLIRALPSIIIEFRKNPKTGQQDTYLNQRNVENEIRSVRVSQIVSPVSKIREVRVQLVKLQRKLSNLSLHQDGYNGVAMDGRDIGTVVFPDADLKIFMTAGVDIRARRRFDEMKTKGVEVNYEDIRQNVMDRDFQDENRDESPLRKADDALVLDNSDMTVTEQMEWFRKAWKKILEDDESRN